MRNLQKVFGAYENRNKSYEKLRKVAGAYEKRNRSYEKNIHSALQEGGFRHFGLYHSRIQYSKNKHR